MKDCQEKFSIGQRVTFLGKQAAISKFNGESEPEYCPINTYVYAINYHLCVSYIIWHPNGHERQKFIGFEGVSENLLPIGYGYLAVHEDKLKDGWE